MGTVYVITQNGRIEHENVTRVRVIIDGTLQLSGEFGVVHYESDEWEDYEYENPSSWG